MDTGVKNECVPSPATGWCHLAMCEALQRQALHTLCSRQATQVEKKKIWKDFMQNDKHIYVIIFLRNP